MKFTVFLDRDGVINVDSPHYIKSASEFHFIPGSAEAIALLTQKNFDVIIITNQSAVGRKMITHNGLESIFVQMKKGIHKAGGEIKDIFFCPHTPDDGCTCRKPEPGLILKAVNQYNIRPSFSAMIGDSAKDIFCARRAGCGYAVLVQTGNGKKAALQLDKAKENPDFQAIDLMDAAKWLIKTVS